MERGRRRRDARAARRASRKSSEGQHIARIHKVRVTQCVAGERGGGRRGGISRIKKRRKAGETGPRVISGYRWSDGRREGGRETGGDFVRNYNPARDRSSPASSEVSRRPDNDMVSRRRSSAYEYANTRARNASSSLLPERRTFRHVRARVCRSQSRPSAMGCRYGDRSAERRRHKDE